MTDKELLDKAEGLLRRYNMSDASKTLDADVITWITDLNASRGIKSHQGTDYVSKINGNVYRADR